MTRKLINIGLVCIYSISLISALHSPAFASSDKDLQTLEMYYGQKDLIVSATRSLSPLSQTAANVTVITADEIAMMGAHTLTDVLNNISGLQTDPNQSVGTASSVTIQGATPNNILVMLDGVTLNFYGSGFPDLGVIPVQNIARIEIIKGPASSSWGSALGGVINIITKSPDDERSFGGTLSASIGERMTRDSRGETAGTNGPLGYYLYVGNLASDGLNSHTGVDENNLYAKLRWELPQRGDLRFTLNYNQGSRQDGSVAADGLFVKEPYSYFLSTLSMSYPLGRNANVDLSLRGSTRSTDHSLNSLSTGDLLSESKDHESTYGGSANLSWNKGFQSLVVGADFDHIDTEASVLVPIQGLNNQLPLTGDKWGIFCNDTLSFGNFAVTPGIRYDRMKPVGDFVSSNLGVTWSPDSQTILRANASRGYSLPLILPGQPQQKVVSIQTGFETSHVPHLTLKATLFWNRTSDVQVVDFTTGNISLARQLRQGVEVETRTVPLFNTSLAVGYTYVDAEDLDTKAELTEIPRQIVKVGLHYNDKHSFRGSLIGRYIQWKASAGENARSKAMIWDLILAKKVLKRQATSLELFFNAHNIFNGAQYTDDFFRNARRWLEGGVRFEF
jgi:vitamin B12 transporter